MSITGGGAIFWKKIQQTSMNETISYEIPLEVEQQSPFLGAVEGGLQEVTEEGMKAILASQNSKSIKIMLDGI